MGYLEVAHEASRYTSKLGTLMFFVSGVGVSFNYYVPNLIPFKLIDGMYWVLLLSIGGMVWVFLHHLKNPHFVIGEKCPKCQKPVIYTGIKCSDHNCTYKVKL